MSIVRVEENIQPLKYLIVTQQKDSESLMTTNVVISDTRNNKINLVSIERGLQGNIGAVGPKGDPGKDGIIFDILPINSGGTNNSVFSSGSVIYYDGNKLTSSNYSIQDILNGVSNNSNLTGIIADSGLYVNLDNNNAKIGINTGAGLTIDDQNTLIIDDTIVRKVELNLGSIDGIVPIDKGGTNNQLFNTNRLLYFDGFKISSFPLATGRILLSGTTIDIVAGSGLIGGGLTSLPSGSVVLNIGGSSDILVETNSISLSSTGIPGTYSKVTTDIKGRIVSGSNLTETDIVNILTYTPWHAGNDGIDSGLDADLLDGQQGSYYLDLANSTGILNTNSLPVQSTPGLYSKVQVNDKGIVINGQDINYGDIVNSLGYRPVSSTGDIIYGPLDVNGSVNLNGDELTINDNLPLLATNSPYILPSEPRGFSFMYGGMTKQTGILAYYPAERELRLITNIGATGLIDAGSGNNFNNEVDGGNANSIYVVGNITGDMNIVLLRSVADSLYVSSFSDQTISGNKTFAQPLTVRGQLTIIPQSYPPFNVGSNTGMVENLNVDLLHGKNLDYYNNAFNMTGLFDYEKVEFNNLEGTVGFIPKFDNRTNNPSRTISDSAIQQTGQIVKVTNNFNFSVGQDNTGLYSANRSTLIGSNNKILGNNSLAVGSYNLVSGNNSIALNSQSQSLADNSIAAGNYGYTWSSNQLSLGSFREFDNNGLSIAQGQYSTIALGISGVNTDGSWTNMSPIINIPKNKTLAYTLELLMNKAAGTGAALFKFESGIIKNSTFRNPENPSFITNITSVLKDHKKNEIYNDSQKRRYYYHFRLDNNNFIQNLDVTDPNIKSPTLKAYNTQTLYKYIPQYITCDGTYKKTHDGSLELNISKPINYGWFYQNSGNPEITIKSYFHGMVSGSIAKVSFLSATEHNPSSRSYEVNQIIDNTNFTIKETSWTGRLTNNEIILDPKILSDIDFKNKIQINTGYIYTNSPDIYNIPQDIINILHTGMYIKYNPYGAEYSHIAPQTGKIITKTNSSITLDSPFTGLTLFGQSINTLASLELISYTKHVFDSSRIIHINISGYGQQSVTIISGAYPSTYCNLPTYSMKVTGLPNNIFIDNICSITPASNNSGTVSLVSHKNISGTYSRDQTRYHRYDGIYIREPSTNGNSRISIYNKNLEPVETPSVPFSYDFICGYGDDDNNLFEIYKSGLYSYLKFKNTGIDISYDLQENSCYFLASRNIGSGTGYIFYPSQEVNSDVSRLPSGINPDITYFPINIEEINSNLYSFNFSESSGGPPVSLMCDENSNLAYTIFPRVRDIYHKDSYKIRIKTSDMSGRNYEKYFTIDIDPIEKRNHVRNYIPDQNAIINELFEFTIPNNTFPAETSIYSIGLSDGRPLPTWLIFNTGIQTFSGIPLMQNSGTLNILVKSTGENLLISDNFNLKITDNSISSLNYITDPIQSFNINNINLSNISVPKNTSYDTNVGKLSTDGGYNPYIIFQTASNNFIGRSHSGSNTLTECSSTSYSYPTITISGNINYLLNQDIIVSGIGSQSNKTVTGILSPVNFSATISYNSNFLLFNEPSINYTNIVFSGNQIFSDMPEWDDNYYATKVTSTGIFLNRNFINMSSSSTGLICFTSGYNLLLDTNIIFSDNILGIFNTPINNSGSYYINGLKSFTSNYLSSERCPIILSKNNNIKGFDTETNEYINITGHYSTGLVSFYTDAGYSSISINSPEDLNFENNEDSIYLNFLSTNNGIKPKNQWYPIISDLGVKQFKIDNGYFFPNIQPDSAGSVLINVEKNHEYKILDNIIINQIPVKFLNTIENNANRQPKNNLFDIIDIKGNSIYVKDDKNYLLKENNRPDYFEQAINASYTTNGFGFNSTFIHNDYKIYDLDYGGSAIWPSEKIIDINSFLGSSSRSFVPNSKLLNFTQGFYFDGTIPRSGNHIAYNGSFPSTVYSGYVMSVFASGSFWPATGIAVNYNEYNYAPLNISYMDSPAFSYEGSGTINNPYFISSNGLLHNFNIASINLLCLGYDYQEINLSGQFSSVSGEILGIVKLNNDNTTTTLFSSNTSSSINVTVTGFPKEIITITSIKTSGDRVLSSLSLNAYSVFNSINIGKRLELLNSINTINSDYTDARFYFKPIITLDQKICLENQEHRKLNNRVFFNGNKLTINNLSTPRSYVNTNDQIKLLTLNNSSNFSESEVSRYAKITSTLDNNTLISGIPVNGLKIQPNSFYPYCFGIKADQELPSSGNLSYIGAVSGLCSIPYYNNLYHHTYGGYTANWPKDPYGKTVVSPLTGVFSIQGNYSQCSSGTMCLNIKGFSTTNFDSIPDLTNRSLIGKQPSSIDTDFVDGYVRPWGISNKKYYFDFSDGAPELNGSYYINDKVDSYNITINIPYNSSYIGRSGLVYIIDSEYNIKSNLNPNIDNSFLVSESNASVTTDSLPSLSVNLIDSKINSFNLMSKRWKHLVHFNNPTSIAYSGYNISFDSSQQTVSQLLYLNPDKINILDIEYSMNYGLSYLKLNDNIINIKTTDEGPIYLKIKTKDGSQKWSQPLLSSAPKINIYGLSSYFIDTNTISYDSYNKIWTINIIIDDIQTYIKENREFVVTISDETGSIDKNFLLNVFKVPIINIPKTIYSYVNSPIPWSVNYDIKDLPDPALIVMSNYPGPSFSINNEIFDNSNGTKNLYGYAGSVTGTFNTVLTVKDYVTGEDLASQTGMIKILPMNEIKPEYSLDPIGLSDNIYLNVDNDNNSSSFAFYIDAINQSKTNIRVNLNGDEGYSRNINIEHNSFYNRFKITVNLVGLEGYYPNKSISISLSQPSPNNDEEEWIEYSFTRLLNITLYKNLSIDRYTMPQPLSFDKQDTWFLQFYVLGGIYADRQDLHPSVKLSNLPNNGSYQTQPLEYNIDYEYDNIGKRWKIIATGRSDSFARMVENLGIKNIKIFVEDSINTVSDNVNLTFTQNKYLTNLQSITYSIPNESYQTVFDIKQASMNEDIIINIPPSLKNNDISLSLINKKYDNNLSLYELSYYGAPIYSKWDANISFNNINNSLTDNQISSLIVQCKGISDDKIYAIGKLNLIELDSFTLPGLPIMITGVNKPYYMANEGSPWRITFKTLYGLENPNFPPTILLSGLPTVCSGYYPQRPLELQNGCLESRVWNPSDKSWNFSFTGFPLCGIEGLKSFSISAIDTDTIQNISFGYDTINGYIKYKSLNEGGFDHPGPQIITVGTASETNQLSPLCNSPISLSYRFGTTGRELCSIPTGITGWTVVSTGSYNLLPSGLSYTITFPGGNPKRPWSNLGSGLLTIQGNPRTFANGGEYNEKLILTVYDARGKSAQKIIKFMDISAPNPPSPVELPVYFDSEKPIYTPRRDARTLNDRPELGSAPIGYRSYPNIEYVYWPPAANYALQCDTILPHNQCPITSFSYSGGDFQSFDFRVFINPLGNNINTAKPVYIEFDNNPSNSFNGKYNLSYQNSQYFITINPNGLSTLSTGVGRLVQERTTNFGTSDLQKFIGNVDITTTNSLLGCGSFLSKSILNEGGYGLFGRMYPSVKVQIPSGVPYSAQNNNSPPLLGMNILRLNNNYVQDTDNNIYTIKTSDCWQTGYLRISGIMLPAPIVELTDPAPASEAYFAYNGQQYYVGSRCVYGNNQDERNLLANKRDVNINYRLKNIISNSVYANSFVTSNQAISFNHTESTGTVFSLFINNNPSVFPTYDVGAIRYAENEYFWIHKAGTKNETITQNSFPPVVIGGIQNIYCVSGQSISGYNGVAVGGYVPFNENWSTQQYAPFISGLIQRRVSNARNIVYSHSGSSNINYQYIKSELSDNPYNISVGDAISISFSNTDIPTQNITLTSGNIIDNTLLIPYSRPGSQQIINGIATFSFLSSITGITSDTIAIKHKNLPLSTGDSVDIVSGSTSTLNNIYPLNGLMTVAEYDSTSAIISYSGSDSTFSNNLVINSNIDIYKNYHNQINISSLNFSKEGYWTFNLSGIPTGLYKDYRYKIVTCENTGLPVFQGTDLSPKKYSSVYNLYINKPIKILLTNNYSIPNNNGSWTLTFSVDGGNRPIQNYTPEVMVNNQICNFSRALDPMFMKDSYDEINDRWNITIASNNNYNWRYDTSFELKLFDDTGFDTKTIIFNNG